ncbi:prepilin peptidase [Nakamurella deserti]|uniref:prepilin peptidase n=1 Tax=Nakamurella deserti TaxID=2164074 RepID=UPI000DBEA8E8|nr:A24 family peptidase [Nakamurella deserti]
MSSWLVPALCALGGAAAGAASRVLLGRLRRGTVVRPGPLEVASALLAGLGGASSFPDGPWPLVLWVGVLAVPLAAVDLRHHRLPDALTLPAVPLTLVVCAIDRWWGGGTGDLGRAAVAGAAVGGLFLLLATLRPDAMGRGDAKLAFGLGIALGYVSWPAVLLGMFGGFLAGSLVGLAGVVTRRFGLRSAIAFGPALLLGCWVVLAVPSLPAWFSGTAGASAAAGWP